ncbi:MAG TPA: acylphosphatase [Candidatus Limnocylindria bacterium]|jgi:acylphosphatase|nr:acylphosphatase [Candidatus Limnocylindria bacterium]
MARARFIVRGMVQGVNFRATAVREALRLGITGRVWNRDDGGVEVVAEGAESSLTALQRWLNEGPRGAQVSDVERVELAGKNRYEGFNITWSAPREP